MVGQRSVLIVDPSEETREVLQTALERRGVRILATGQAETGRELAQRHQPDLIVMDVEFSSVSGVLPTFCGTGVPPVFSGAGETPAPQGQYQPRLVLLGTFRRQGGMFPRGEFIAKPYHYGALIHRIEELLEGASEKIEWDRADVVCHPRDRPGNSL